jgi:hypothetical protein
MSTRKISDAIGACIATIIVLCVAVCVIAATWAFVTWLV